MSNGSRIAHDQFNNSTSKQQYSFGQEQRFSSAEKAACPVAFYGNSSTLSSRKASIGYGTKYNFQDIDKNIPGPASYHIPDQFEIASQTKIGFTFGVSREQIQYGHFVIKSNTPGVGAYDKENQRGEFLQSNKGVQFPSKNDKTSLFYQKNSYPGPGAYPWDKVCSMNPDGKYFLSQFQNLKGTVGVTSKRFTQDASKTSLSPGPGHYIENDPTTLSGKIMYDSRKRSVSGFIFGKDQRNTISLPHIKNPAPGEYTIRSQFGDVDFPKPVSSSRIYSGISSTAVK